MMKLVKALAAFSLTLALALGMFGCADYVSVEDIELNETVVSLTLGGENNTFQIQVTYIPENATVDTCTYESTDTSVATVDANGLVTAVAVGSCDIKVVSTSNKVEKTLRVTVSGGWDGTAATDDELNAITDSATLTMIVSDAGQLAGISKNVNSGKNSYQGYTIVLNNDIHLNNCLWEPIGMKDASGKTRTFDGKFDGRGHTISNLRIEYKNDTAVEFPNQADSGVPGTINGTATKSDTKLGLFGYVGETGDVTDFTIFNATVDGRQLSINSSVSGGGATAVAIGNTKASGAIVKNIHLRGQIRVDGSYFVGGIIGYGSNNTIENCTVEGDIQMTGVLGIGGVIGYGHTNVTLRDCHVSGNPGSAIRTLLGTYDHTGGLLGKTGYGEGICTAENCTVAIDIYGVGGGIGGIAGNACAGASIKNCSYEGTLTLTGAGENTWKNMGALVGTTEKSGCKVLIENCTASAVMSAYLEGSQTPYTSGFLYDGLVGSSKGTLDPIPNGSVEIK